MPLTHEFLTTFKVDTIVNYYLLKEGKPSFRKVKWDNERVAEGELIPGPSSFSACVLRYLTCAPQSGNHLCGLEKEDVCYMPSIVILWRLNRS